MLLSLWRLILQDEVEYRAKKEEEPISRLAFLFVRTAGDVVSLTLLPTRQTTKQNKVRGMMKGACVGSANLLTVGEDITSLFDRSLEKNIRRPLHHPFPLSTGEKMAARPQTSD